MRKFVTPYAGHVSPLITSSSYMTARHVIAPSIGQKSQILGLQTIFQDVYSRRNGRVICVCLSRCGSLLCFEFCVWSSINRTKATTTTALLFGHEHRCDGISANVHDTCRFLFTGGRRRH